MRRRGGMMKKFLIILLVLTGGFAMVKAEALAGRRMPGIKLKTAKRYKKYIKVTWGRNTRVDGYKIYAAKDKKFHHCLGGVNVKGNHYTEYKIRVNQRKLKKMRYVQIVGWKKKKGKVYHTRLTRRSIRKVK
ncbi:MAG: hypothetical protein Q4D60_00875 [Eubacteriales bacterium]|nr:hypothetical protein [Eubacteriales bacterium]